VQNRREPHCWRKVTNQLIIDGAVSASWSQVWKELTSDCHLSVHTRCGRWRTWRVDSLMALQQGHKGESHCFHLAIVIPTAKWPDANLDAHMQYVGGLGDKVAFRRDQSTKVAKWLERRPL